MSLSSILFPEAVKPLNFADDQEYIESVYRPAPKNLGIAIETIGKEGDPAVEASEMFISRVLIGAVNQLIMCLAFRERYMPTESEEFEVGVCGTEVPMTFWHPFPHVKERWMVDDIVIVVFFYDADREITEQELDGIGAGMIAVQECIAETGSVVPSADDLLYLDPAESREHKEVVGTVYENHVGVWCESLVPLWDVLMHKLHAYLKTVATGGLLAYVEQISPASDDRGDNPE